MRVVAIEELTMPVITQSNYLSLGEVYSKLNLQKSPDSNFFYEWQDIDLSLSKVDRDDLDHLKDELQEMQEYSANVEIVKMFALGPVLRLAGMGKDPFLPKPGYVIEIDLNYNEQDASIIHSRVELFISHVNLWSIVIETKRSTSSVFEALPQTLSYMMASRENNLPIYGLCTNGIDFVFVKLLKGDMNQYALSDPFSIYRRSHNELYDVVSILKRLATIVLRMKN